MELTFDWNVPAWEEGESRIPDRTETHAAMISGASGAKHESKGPFPGSAVCSDIEVDGIHLGQPTGAAGLTQVSDLRVLSDEELMRRVVLGNVSAFEVLYSRYVLQCCGLAMKIVRNRAAAEEVVQEVFFKLWRQPTTFSSKQGKFLGWLLTLVHNRAVDELRRAKARSHRATVVSLDAEYEAGVNLVGTLQDTGPTPDDYAWNEERGRMVRYLLDYLPETHRQALSMAYFEGLTQKEIAEHLNKPLGTVKTRTRLGLQQLRRLIAGQGPLRELCG